MAEDELSPFTYGAQSPSGLEQEQVPAIQRAQSPSPSLVICSESRATSPPPQPEFASVGIGSDVTVPLMSLPSGVSLNRVIEAVREHQGSDLRSIIGTLIDRPWASIPDDQRESLYTLLNVAAVAYRECGKNMMHAVQEVRQEWNLHYRDRDPRVMEEYQQRVRLDVDRHLHRLAAWYLPTVEFSTVRFDPWPDPEVDQLALDTSSSA